MRHLGAGLGAVELGTVPGVGAEHMARRSSTHCHPRSCAHAEALRVKEARRPHRTPLFGCWCHGGGPAGMPHERLSRHVAGCTEWL